MEKSTLSLLFTAFFAIFFPALQANSQRLQSVRGYCGIYYKSMEDLFHQKQVELDFYQFKPGEKVASIGAQCGHWEAVLAAASDNLEFTLEDIDTTWCNQRQVGFAWHYYDSLRGKPLGSFHIVRGTEQSTELAPAYFDKILIINSLHEFSHKDEMLSDIRQKLKPGGILFIDEPLPSKPGELHGGCHKPMITEEEMNSLLLKNGFHPSGTLPIQFRKHKARRIIYAFTSQ